MSLMYDNNIHNIQAILIQNLNTRIQIFIYLVINLWFI
jgi:hypothetical protein